MSSHKFVTRIKMSLYGISAFTLHDFYKRVQYQALFYKTMVILHLSYQKSSILSRETQLKIQLNGMFRPLGLPQQTDSEVWNTKLNTT